MDRCVDQVTEEYGGKVLHSSARTEYTIRRMKRILNRSIWALHQQLAAGNYQPQSFEVSFEALGEMEAVTVDLQRGSRMKLQGRIDRIDTYETEDSVYIKITDYKSGMTQFDPVSLYYGLQLQLIVYLNAALEMEQRVSGGKETVPAGIFYYHMQDPVLDKESGLDEEKLREKLLKKLKPDGIVNSDKEILQTLDREIGSDSLVVPAAFKKDGTLRAGSSAISTKQFASVSRFVRRKMAETGRRMMDGEIAPNPVKNKQQSACDFCEFADVCGFDRKLPGMCEQKLPELSKEEAWNRIFEEGAKEGEE
jgi:ATP-dependent helicase/nuclease subunit B